MRSLCFALGLGLGMAALSSCTDRAPNDTASFKECTVACSVDFPRDQVVWVVPWGLPTSTFCSGETGQCEVLAERCVEGWCYVPAGTFQAGVTKFDEGRSMLSPARHTAIVKRAFWAQQRETTNAEWKEVMGATVSPSLLRACGDDCPVADMNVFDVAEFANRLSVRAGLEPCYEPVHCGAPDPQTQAKRQCSAIRFPHPDCNGYRLPTEVEWELAARAGSSGCWANGEVAYPYGHCRDGAELPLVKHAWFCGNSHVDYEGCLDLSHQGGDAGTCMGVHPVGTTQPNRLGLYDTAGNVMEMTGTVREPNDPGPMEGARVVNPGHEPIIVPTDAVRMRGGGFPTRAGYTCACESIAGHAYQPNDFGFVGFRLVRLATEAP